MVTNAGNPESASATVVPAVAPSRNWPSAPMLNTPARKAIATASPVSTSGVARTSVPDPNAYQDPNAPVKSAVIARPTLAPVAASIPAVPSNTTINVAATIQPAARSPRTAKFIAGRGAGVSLGHLKRSEDLGH